MGETMSVFTSTELLIPREELLADWAVIACDQFTSEPAYWQAVRARTAGKPSALEIIFPEAELDEDRAARIASINAAMRRDLEGDIFRRFPDSFVYVERRLLDGSLRRGLVGVIDLDAYDYAADAVSAVRATEQTVLERIPPRVQIREGAVLETSHVMLLADDRRDGILSACESIKESLPRLYDLELMQGGGHIVGRLISGEAAETLRRAVSAYEEEASGRCAALGQAPLLYAVGDGNHSLAAAKACWERRKAARPALAGTDDPARYAMVELQNIHDASQRFEPIHRLLLEVDAEALSAAAAALSAPGGYPIRCFAAGGERLLTLDPARGALPVAILQPFLDAYLKEHGGRIDYIHGEESAIALAREKGGMALLLPAISKTDFFRGIAEDGVLPRKTFSMGHAREKRYYLECRRIR